MRRLSALGALSLAFAVWYSAAVPERATATVDAPLLFRDPIEIAGVGCGAQASSTLPLPANAFGVQVRRPTVGARDGGDARVTQVAVQGSAVTVTALADSSFICDPGSDPTPPADRPWTARFDAEVGFKQRLPVTARTDWQRRRAGFVTRPRTVGLSQSYVPGGLNTVRRVRWKQFGGRKAVGFGVFKAGRFFCPSPRRCTVEDGKPVRVELTRPGYCTPDNIWSAGEPVTNFVFYGKVAAIARRRIGAIRPGREIQSYKGDCGGAPPIRIR